MESFMGGAMMIETALLSFLLALWISWMGMRGLFRLDAGCSRLEQRQSGWRRAGSHRVPGRSVA